MAQAASFMTETERVAHYRELAAQFREWAKTETNEEARAGLLDMARQ
jgi:crotonobetainyl-CoA:carnitine CoA-transferase CaiB-like acyl-CoA transferase